MPISDTEEIKMAVKPLDSKAQIRRFLLDFQQQLTTTLGQLDGRADFHEDIWQRSGLGGGKTRVIAEGELFEQGGVNFSEIQGDQVPAALLVQRPGLAGNPFWAAGVSMVLHPLSPFCPTVHLNYRYFEAGPYWWFGGGADLTPYYAFAEDCVHWHQMYKDAMDQHDSRYYPAFKYWCDEYFYNHHRSESRGIGGSFYDYQDGAAGPLIKADGARQSADDHHPALAIDMPQRSWQQLLAFQQSNAAAFLPAYLPIVNRRRALVWSEQQRQFQLYRRGRYVEFNLLHDRGTIFGIQSKGRTESILMSLPPQVRWQYNYHPEKGTPEYDLTARYLQRGVDWVDAPIVMGS